MIVKHLLIQALRQSSVIIPQVHAIALAPSPYFAEAARAGFHPFMVAIPLETVFPYFGEIILKDVALMVFRAYAETA